MLICLGLGSAIAVSFEVKKNPSSFVTFVGDLFAVFLVVEMVCLDEFEEESDEVTVFEFLDDGFGRH